MNVFDIYKELKMKNITLTEICYELGVNPPIYSGKHMNEYYWENKTFEIQEHCESDVRATAEVYTTIYNQNNHKHGK
jgi:hypothetical protein